MKKNPRLRRRRVRGRLGSINLKEVERSRPWSVFLQYEFKRGYSPGCPAFDRGTLFAVAGRPSDSSGAGGGWRDHTWDCKTYEEAEALVNALVTVPGIYSLELRGDMFAHMLRARVEKARKKKMLHRFPDGTAMIFHGRVRRRLRRHRVRRRVKK